jgi:5-(aminomethyl)-3-furanmethanol phosphate kinase
LSATGTLAAVGPALVLKLGGSLAESGRLTGIADMVVRAQAPVVVVPGGGPFADAVRRVQPQLKLTDAAAHRLALLAMHQMGLVIAARHARFATAERLDDIARLLVLGAIPVWQPYPLQSSDDTIPADWTATSDALSARLAERMGGPGAGVSVALVKSCPVPAGAGLIELTAAGIADPVFAQVVTRTRLSWTIYGAGDEGRLAKQLALDT